MNRGQLVKKWVRKRQNPRFGAGWARGQGDLAPLGLPAFSKRPGCKIALSATNPDSAFPPAPNRRFCRFWTKKTTTCHPEESERVPRDSRRSELAYAVIYLFGNEARVEKTPFRKRLGLEIGVNQRITGNNKDPLETHSGWSDCLSYAAVSTLAISRQWRILISPVQSRLS